MAKMKSSINMNKEIHSYIEKNDLDTEINEHIFSIFLLSQNLPCQGVSDFFSGENFSLSESYEELKISYNLIRLGYLKQAMVSLRTSLEIGLLSIYWSIKGKNSSDFKKWLSSNDKTPFKNKSFWNTLKSNDKIRKFDLKFNLFEEIKGLGTLSDYVHTNGMYFSNHGKMQQGIKKNTNNDIAVFNDWLISLKKIVKILEILHLLKFPTINLRFEQEYLLSKFGTLLNIPQFGGGFGEEMNIIGNLIPIIQKTYIEKLAKEDNEVKYIVKWLEELPILSPTELKNEIIQSAKVDIEMSGFKNWLEYSKKLDKRITGEMVDELKKWAEINECMTFEQKLRKLMPKEKVDLLIDLLGVAITD